MNYLNLQNAKKYSVLVTGAQGFIGKNVVIHAQACGHSVSGIGHGNLSSDVSVDLHDFCNVDSDITVDALSSLDLKPDVIIHCASSASVSFSVAHPAADFSRTVNSTLSVLEFIRLHSPTTKLVLPSSAAVYGSCNSLPLHTNDVLQPVSPYGLHKKFSEDLCIQYGQLFGIHSSIVRLFSVYGCGLRKQLLWDACTKLSSGLCKFDGTGDETRDWLHVSDAAKLLLLSSEYSSTTPPIVNGGTESKTSISEVVHLISSTIPGSPRPAFSGTIRQGDPKNLIADISLPKKWGWHPLIDVKTGILEYTNWYKGLS